MRTAKIIDVFNAIVRRHGIDPLQGTLNSDLARAVMEHIQNRVHLFYQSWDWLELSTTEERAFRQVWVNTAQYSRTGENAMPDEVYYLPTTTYYSVRSDAVSDPAIGDLPTDTNFWNVIDPMDNYIELDQPGQTPIGYMLGVYKLNPRICRHGGELDYRPSEHGIDVRSHCPTVWVHFMLTEPTFSFSPYVPGKSYSVGDVIFYETDGNCYSRLIAGSDLGFNIANWTLQNFPATFRRYVQAGAYADSLLETFVEGEDQIRLARSQAASAEAERWLESEVGLMQRQNQRHQWHFCRRDRHEWIRSIPWSGDAINPLGTPMAGLATILIQITGALIGATEFPVTLGLSAAPSHGPWVWMQKQNPADDNVYPVSVDSLTAAGFNVNLSGPAVSGQILHVDYIP